MGGVFQGQITRKEHGTKCDIIDFQKPQIVAVSFLLTETVSKLPLNVLLFAVLMY